MPKGIFTITQLFYGYRPRRRKRARTDVGGSAEAAKRAAQADRNDHKLKALAIKKNQIHVVGAPSLTLAAVPIFLDIEGMSDRIPTTLSGFGSRAVANRWSARSGPMAWRTSA